MSDDLFVPSAARASLVALAQWRAQHQTDRPGYTFLVDGETTEARLTYGELDRKARHIGALLQQRRLAGQRALLLYPPGLDYITAFFGCLYGGVVAVPAYPPNPARLSRSLTRLRALVDDAAPAVVLTTASHLPIAETLRVQVPDFPRMDWFATDTETTDQAESWHSPGATSETLAFLQYTSGSTALPKGVMLSHGNLLHNSSLIHHAFGHSPESRGVIWLPPYHDMGLIGGILQPLYGGFPVTLMSPVDFLQRPLRWLQTISRTGGTTSGGPNFAYDLCTRKVTSEQLATLDLRSWTLAFNGAEPIRPETLERFAAMFAPCGFRREAFYPCYGLAEATLIVAGGGKAAPPVIAAFDRVALGASRVVETAAGDEISQAFVGSGQALLEQQIAIVDPQTGVRCQPDQVGEIWVSGPSVAQGYWNRPDASEQTFRARLADTGASQFLRTGDLGFLRDGELFVTGRLKDLIIIRGRNYYPQDIELTVERSHPALRPGSGAAFAVEVGGEEQVVVVQEVDRQHRRVEIEAVAGAIRQAVAEQHELRVYAIALIKHGSIPKTSSGKIQRHACRSQFLSGDLQLLGRSTLEAAGPDRGDELLSREDILAIPPAERQARIAAYLTAQVAQVLRAAPPSENAAIGSLGLDSLMAVDLQYRLESGLGVLVSMAQFFDEITLAQLAAQIRDTIAADSTGTAVLSESAQVSDEYPLSPGQQAIWFLHQLAPESAAYNIASAARVNGDLDIPALRRVFQRIVDRHPALRTTFSVRAGDPVQTVQPAIEVGFHYEDASRWHEQELNDRLSAEAHRPFSLAQGPLLRVSLFKRAEHEHVLLLAVHHIVADLWSLATIVNEIGQLYPAARDDRSLERAPLSLRYADYVLWQRNLLAGPNGERLWSYWQQQIHGVPTRLELPTDRPRPTVQTFAGATQSFRLSQALTQSIKTLALNTETTPYMVLLAAFQLLLYRYSGQAQFLVGSPTSGRSRARLADSVGYFVNPVALQADLSGQPTFTELLGRVRRTVQGALNHNDYPFPLLVERLQPDRDPSRSPLFQTMFVFQQAPIAGQEDLAGFALGDHSAHIQIDGLRLEAITLEQQVAQFDMTLMMAELEDGLAGSLHYNTDLFDPETIARIAGHLHMLLEAIVADPGRPVTELPLLTPSERQQILLEWNTTALDVPHDVSIQRYFEAQAARTPDATALIAGNQRLSYQELNQRANQLAHALRERGVGPEVRVGVCVARSPELVIALLAVLKAGGAYVPLDPNYPQERLRFMLDDAQAALLITQAALRERLPGHTTALLCLDTDWQSITELPTSNPPTTSGPLNLAYLIYTSGSTGRPKGVAIVQRSAAVLLAWSQQVYTREQLAGVLASTSVCFDLSVYELFAPLSCGGTIILADHALQLPALSAAQAVTLINTVPSAAVELLRINGLPSSIQTVNLAGEPLSQRLAQDLYRHAPIRQVINLYGPSEDTTYSTFAVIPKPCDEAPAIGRPIANTQIYVLDARMQPVPIGVPGELYLGGEGLARGYLNRPEITAERFIPNPFADGYAQDGSRLYRTGDRVRYRSDGALEFLGRIDQQVKVRGFRIELGEIEAVLRQHEAIAEAVVIVREDAPARDQRIVAYVVQNQDIQRVPGTENRTSADDCSLFSVLCSPQDLRAFLQARLPHYMVPSAFVVLDALPLTPNGKIDRRALPAPDAARLDDQQTYVAPRVPVEEQLAGIWSEILGIERIGVYDNFFQLGGHSLQATRLIAQVSEAFQIDLPLRNFFEAPRIADLAVAITQQRSTQVEQDDLALLLSQLEHLSEDEIQRFLASSGGE